MKRPSVYINIITEYISLRNSDERYLSCSKTVQSVTPSRDSKEVLIEFLDDRVISKGLWPPCFQHLSIPDFFLWGYLKNAPFKNNPPTLDELKSNILHAILDMKPHTLR
ncbi:uncharacterized protein TNCV_1018581 [Trichonephila clavipes]|nr:uncharacterized protein TNCV_1018581 [Trichonephila clavipes]